MSENTNPSVEGNTTENEAAASTEEQQAEEFVSKADFDKTYKESMKRKATIKELKAKVAELEGTSKVAEEATESVEKYRMLLEQKDTTIKELQYKGTLRNALDKLEPVSDRVTDLAYADASAADVLDDTEDLSNFLSQWKKDNPSFFKAGATTATSPVQKPTVEPQPVEGASALDEVRAMSPDERAKLPASKREQAIRDLASQVYKQG